MKYVVFQTPEGRRVPVLFPDSLNHCDVQVSGAKPVSAGFANQQFAVSATPSESLKLGPADGDRTLLDGLVMGSAVSALIDQVLHEARPGKAAA